MHKQVFMKSTKFIGVLKDLVPLFVYVHTQRDKLDTET